jgi:hypothetical protein
MSERDDVVSGRDWEAGGWMRNLAISLDQTKSKT